MEEQDLPVSVEHPLKKPSTSCTAVFKDPVTSCVGTCSLKDEPCRQRCVLCNMKLMVVVNNIVVVKQIEELFTQSLEGPQGQL